MLNVLIWAVLGLVAGAIAKMIYPGTQGGGILATIALGITGAFVGGFLHTFITTGRLALAATGGFSLYSVIFAVLGSLVVIFLWGLVTRNA